jgi:hypothetical protein
MGEKAASDAVRKTEGPVVASTQTALAREPALQPSLEERRAVLRRHRRRQALRDWLSVSVTGLVTLTLAVMAILTFVGAR